MHPIVVGVDGSAESVRAAAFGAALAARVGTTCHLVNAVPPYWASLPPELGLDIAELDKSALQHARTLINQTLQGTVPDRVLGTLEVATGRAPLVLTEAAGRLHAEAVVMGGKHHRALARLGGSSITHLVRSGTVPVLAVSEQAAPSAIERVLVPVDLSHAARATIAVAERWAAHFGARLRVMHSVEPMPVVPGITLSVAEDEVFRSTERMVETTIAPLVSYPGAEIVVRRGRSAAAIVSEAEQWDASLIVLGSHGKGWVDRILLGSTSERLLQLLPRPTLVVPVEKPAHAEASLAAQLPWMAPMAPS